MDRTSEYKAAVTSVARIRERTGGFAGAGVRPIPPKSAKSEFTQRASGIAHDITDAYGMLQRLAKLAKRKALVDDNSEEVAQLTQIIKQRLSQINESIGALQRTAKDENSAWAGKSARKQHDDFNKNVVVMLQGKLTDVATNFTEVLETRTKNVQAFRSRSEKFMPASEVQTPDNPLYRSQTPYRNSRPQSPAVVPGKPIGNDNARGFAENPYSRTPSSYLVANEPPEDPAPHQQLSIANQEQALTLLEEQQTSYLSSRSSAVDTIESTINELGSIFKQLSTMISEQRETVQRIDANTDDISLNVGAAHRELLKYYARVSSNRWLMIKSMGVVLVFFILWVLIA